MSVAATPAATVNFALDVSALCLTDLKITILSHLNKINWVA
jgi:zona occludens toxin (predicted ATPase)